MWQIMGTCEFVYVKCMFIPTPIPKNEALFMTTLYLMLFDGHLLNTEHSY